MNDKLLYKFGYLAGLAWKPFSYLENSIPESHDYERMLSEMQRGWLEGRKERYAIDNKEIPMTHDEVNQLVKQLFPHGIRTEDDETGEVVIRTGLRESEDGPLERCYDDNDNYIEPDWEDEGEPICEVPVERADDVISRLLNPDDA